MQITKEFLIESHRFFWMNSAFSLTKKTIPLRGVTYAQLFGQSKRTPIFERNSLFLRSYFFEIRLDVRMVSSGEINETPIPWPVFLSLVRV